MNLRIILDYMYLSYIPELVTVQMFMIILGHENWIFYLTSDQ